MNKAFAKLKIFLFFIIFLCFGNLLYAQKTVKGKITKQEDSTAAANVRIDVKGTKKTTLTDAKGAFKIAVGNSSTSKKAVLVISLEGYETQEILVGKQTVINVVIKKIPLATQDTLLGNRIKGILIKQERQNYIENTPVSSFEMALQGRVAGLQIIQSSGVPSATNRVILRGGGGISGGTNPLYVLDGIPISTEDINNFSSQNTNFLSNINLNDIETIEVIKDASAGAMYGARAANGVILLTSKQGKIAKTSFNLNYYTGISQVTNQLSMLNGQQWLDLYNEARSNDGKYGRISDGTKLKGTDGLPLKALTANEIIPNLGIKAGEIANTNWINETLQTAVTQNLDLSLQGGNDKTRFFIAGNYFNQGSILKTGNFERISTRVNITNQATEKLSFGIQFNLSATKNNTPPTSYLGGIGVAQSIAAPVLPIYNTDNSYFGTQFFNTQRNPLAVINNNTYTTTGISTIGSLYATYKLSNAISLRSQIGINFYNQLENYYTSPINRYYNGQGLGVVEEREINNFNWVTTHTATFDKKIADNHHLYILGGFELQDNTTRYLGFTPLNNSVGFTDTYFTTVTSSLNNDNLVKGFNGRDFYRFASTFLRANYTFKQKYVIGLGTRIDGASRFGKNNLYGAFPVISAAWYVSEEKFLQKFSFINYLKLRTSFGQTGSSAIGNFSWLGAYASSGSYAGQAGLNYARLPNPDLSAELKTILDISLDYQLFKNKVYGTISFYNANSSAVFTQRPVQSSSGFTNVTLNDANIKFRNRGIELSISTKNITAKTEGDLEWTTTLTIAHNQNIVTNADGISQNIAGDSLSYSRIIEGQPLGISYLAKTAGVDTLTGVEMIYDLQGQKTPLTQKSQFANRQAVGKPNPDFFGGISNTIKYKNFDFSILFSFSYGNTIYDEAAKYQIGGIGQNLWNQRTEVLNRWQKPGDVTNVPRLSTEIGNVSGYNTDRFLYDASYIRLRALQIGYTLPKKISSKAKLSNARIYLSGQNLWTMTKYAGWDPEVLRYGNTNLENNLAYNTPFLATPQAKTITFGLSLAF
jgi:TonB-linked SusC/RagA family outer membrane protein